MKSDISGFASRGFEPVRDAFIQNFERGEELGAACCVFHDGQKVVDLWGGIRDARTGAPWEEDTMVLVYSTTKGLAGLAMALAHSRGLYEYDAPVSTYWPEFARNGKERITVRQLLSHQAGLYTLDVRPDAELVADPDRLAAVLARQRQAWPPGDRQAYHGITLGFYESELIRRVDPKGRTLGEYFREELADPLGIDFHIRLPEEIPDRRLAPLQHGGRFRMLFTLPLPFLFAALTPGSKVRRCLEGSELPEKTARVYARNLEIPAGGGVGTARGAAAAYSEFATGGKTLRLREDTLHALMAPPRPPRHGFRDECLKVEIPFSLGFAKPSTRNPFGHPTSFGAPGTGGSFAFADPHARLGYAYFPNRMGTSLEDPRERVIRAAVYRCIEAVEPGRGARRARTSAGFEAAETLEPVS